MKVELSPEMQRFFFATSYPARVLATMSRDAMVSLLTKPDAILCYNSRAKIFNIFACDDLSKIGKKGSTNLFLVYDQDTDELELICSAIEIAGRKLLFQGDYPEQPGQVREMVEYYREQQEAIRTETDAITEKILDGQNRMGENPK